MADKTSYRPLLTDSISDQDEIEENSPLQTGRSIRKRLLRYSYILNTVVSWTLVLGLSITLIRDRTTGLDRFRQHKLYPAQLTYSPAQDVIEYEVKVFHKGQEDMPSKFQGPPSPELDQAWEELYEGGISSISEKQARNLVNYTTEIPGHDGEYVVQLDVFHQLHCLNMIRQALAPVYFTDWDAMLNSTNTDWTPPECPYKDMPAMDGHTMTPAHLAHCIENMRQSFMCHADVSTVVWQWDEDREATYGYLNVAHTCRNYEKIHEWAKSHAFNEGLDHYTKMPVRYEVPIYD